MTELTTVADMLQTFGANGFLAIMIALYIKEKSYSRQQTAELVSHSKELGEALAGVVQAAQDMKTMQADMRSATEKLGDLRLAADDLKHAAARLDRVRDSEA